MKKRDIIQKEQIFTEMINKCPYVKNAYYVIYYRKNKENTKEEYKVNYFFAENSKININEIFKNSFLLSLKAEGKNM